MKLMKVIAVVGVGAASLAAAAVLFTSGWSWISSLIAQDPVCSAGKFAVESHIARTEGQRTVVTVAVRNNNSIACGVEVSVAVRDTGGKQIAIESLWAGGASNIPAGATQSFPVYLSIEVSAQAVDYEIKAINARVWRQL